MVDAVKITDADLEAMGQQTGDNPEYIKQMLNKADQGTDTSGSVNGSQDQLLAGKYKTPEDLEKGIMEAIKMKHGGNLEEFYKTLESDLGKKDSQTGNQSADDQNTGDALSQDSQDGDDAAGDDADALSGDDGSDDGSDDDTQPNFDKYTEELNTEGKLSEESYKELEKAGYPKGMVDNFIAGQVAINQLFESQVTELAGGKESYTKMIEWAQEGLSDKERQTFNNAIAGRDMDNIKLMVDALKSRYTKANGDPPQNRLQPQNNSNSSNSDTYQNIRELSMDQRDPRYNTDPRFRQYVMDKAKRSKI